MNKCDPNFELFKEKIPRQFGGARLKSNPKIKRPLSTKYAIHLVLKSELARGNKSFLRARNVDRIDQIVRGRAKKCGVRILHFVNVGNHIHLVVKLHDRQAYASFIRVVTGLIARHVLQAQRNASKGLKFWQARPFTRLVSWGRDYNRVKRYMEKNREQARGGFTDWGFSVTDPWKIANLDSG
jgi:REP element-mobilizing transposase RayT